MIALEHASNTTFVYRLIEEVLVWAANFCLRWELLFRYSTLLLQEIFMYNPRAWSSTLDDVMREDIFEKENANKLYWKTLNFVLPGVNVKTYSKVTGIYGEIQSTLTYNAVRHCFWSFRFFDAVFHPAQSVFPNWFNRGYRTSLKEGGTLQSKLR